MNRKTGSAVACRLSICYAALSTLANLLVTQKNQEIASRNIFILVFKLGLRVAQITNIVSRHFESVASCGAMPNFLEDIPNAKS